MPDNNTLEAQLLQRASSIGADNPPMQMQAMPLNPGMVKGMSGAWQALGDTTSKVSKFIQALKDYGPSTATDVKDPLALAKTTFFDEYPRNLMHNAAGWAYHKYAQPKLREYGLPSTPGEVITKVRSYLP